MGGASGAVHGGETADSESSLFAVARHVLSRNGALDGDGETLRGAVALAADEQAQSMLPDRVFVPTTRAFV